MGKLPQISKASKSNVILLKQEGYKNVEISKRLKLSEASVSRILERNKQNLSLSPLKRSGRPRTTTPRTDCKIKQLCQKQPFISSSEIKRSMQELISVTTRTIRNRMHKDFKLRARKPLKKPLIIGGHGTLQKYRGTGTRYFAKISTAVSVPVLSS